MNISESTLRFFTSISEIDDYFLEEAELADITSDIALRKSARRKRFAGYGALATVASVGVAVAFHLIRAKRATTNVGNVTVKIA